MLHMNGPEGASALFASGAWDRPDGEPSFQHGLIETTHAIEALMNKRTPADLEPPVERHAD